MFKITDGKGFHMRFSNGYTLSVQFGFGNYCNCKNYELRKGFSQMTHHLSPTFEEDIESPDAEIAVIYGDENIFLTREVWMEVFGEDIGDNVKGYVSPDKVGHLIANLYTRE